MRTTDSNAELFKCADNHRSLHESDIKETKGRNQNHYHRSNDNNRHIHRQLLHTTGNHRYPTNKQILANHGYLLTNTPKLGYGRYSKVCQGIHFKSGEKVAVKIIDTRKVTQEYKYKFLPREIHTWKRLRHPNLVALFAVYEEAGKVFLPMELAEKGDLLTFIQQNGAQPEMIAQKWMKQLTSAIYYMHMRSIAHRDLKLENILLFADDSIKIADFGFCREIEDGDLSLTFCGSKSYSAPEILLGQAYPPFKADIWSLGVVAFVLVTNRMPYDERVGSNSLLVEAQRNRNYRYSKKLQISHICKDTIDTMMTFNYHARPDIQQKLRVMYHSLVAVTLESFKLTSTEKLSAALMKLQLIKTMNLEWFHITVAPVLTTSSATAEHSKSGGSCTTA